MIVYGKPVVPRSTLTIDDIREGVRFCNLDPLDDFIMFGTFTGEKLGSGELGQIFRYEPSTMPGSALSISSFALGMAPINDKHDIWSSRFTIAW